MGHHQEGGLGRLMQRLDGGADFFPEAQVDGGQGFIQKQDMGADDQRLASATRCFSPPLR